MLENDIDEQALALVLAARDRNAEQWGINEHAHVWWLSMLSESHGDIARAVNREQFAIEEGAASVALDQRKLMIEALAVNAAQSLGLLTTLMRKTCRVCGCTEEFACDDGCSWAMPGLCTTCAPLPADGGGE